MTRRSSHSPWPVRILALALFAAGLGGCTTRSSLGWAQTGPSIQPSAADPAVYDLAPIGLASYADEAKDEQAN